MADLTTYGLISVQGLTLEKLLRVISNATWKPTAVSCSGTISADTIAEYTGAAGVTIDNLLIKDGTIPGGLAGGISNIGTTAGATTIDWDDGRVQTIVIGGSHTITVAGASSHNKAGTIYFLYVDSNAQNPSWAGVDWTEPTWSDNHLVMFISLAAEDTMLGVDLGGGYTELIPT
jgi:hypothetical protein